MIGSRKQRVRFLTALMELLDRHPLAAKVWLRPIANAPLLSKRLMVLPRALMGASAFEIHDVDMERGRIGIGGVEEIMAGAKLVHLLHTSLAERLGQEEKNQTLYDLGTRLCRWEVGQALEHGKWAPAPLVPLIAHARILDEVRTDSDMARFFQKTMETMSRLITDEGGWGHLDFELHADPLRVLLSHSQEARWLGPAEEPVCHFYRGIVAGYAGAISGEEIASVEVECAAMGAPRCVFELIREGAASP